MAIRFVLALLAILLGCAVDLSAQSVVADRFVFNNGPCTLRSGSGSPEGVVTGKVCDTYWRTDTGIIYTKVSGTGNTGWTTAGGVTGSGTANALAKWTAATSLGNATITDDGSAITFSNTGDIFFNPGGNDVMPTTGYDINLGHLTKKYLTLHAAELWVETLVAQNTLATIGGRVVVAPTNILTRDLLATDAGVGPNYQTGNFCVKYNSFLLHVGGVELGSKIIMQSNGKFEAFAIIDTVAPTVTGAGDYCYIVFRNQDGTGLNDWYAGDAALDTGKTGSGFIDLYSMSGLNPLVSAIGPTIVGNVRLSDTYNNWAPRWAIGNLQGLYGYGSSNYGAAFGDPFGPVVTIDDTNGMRMYDGLLNLRIHMTPDGQALFNGDGDGMTNIDGGNIQTHTITVGQILATGFGDNAVKNGTFEGDTTTKGLAGWVKDPQSTAAAAIVRDCCGQNGPGVLLLAPTNGFHLGAVYLATPVVPGQIYRVAGRYFANASSAAGWYVGLQEYSTPTQGVRHVLRSGATAPDVNAGTATYLCSNCAVTGGWQTFQYTYTVPSGVYWASFSVFNQTGSVSGSVYTAMYFDDIEMQKKIGDGHIIANSITANSIAANTITAGQIASNTITAAQIATNTLTANEIAANAITASELAADSVTADKIDVTSLSAISADVGTLTAGTIDGVTVVAGSGDEVTLNSDGITLGFGSSPVNRVKWGDGSTYIEALSDGQTVFRGLHIYLRADAGGSVSVDQGRPFSATGTFEATGTVRLSTLGGAGANQFVCVDNEGDLYQSNTTCDGSAPVSASNARIEALEREVAELRAIVQQLIGVQK